MLGLSTTAHPKIDGRTGQMILHGYSPVEPFLTLYVIEPDGRVSLAEAVDAPYGVMMHDVAITENHVIFPLVPVLIDLSVVEQGVARVPTRATRLVAAAVRLFQVLGFRCQRSGGTTPET